MNAATACPRMPLSARSTLPPTSRSLAVVRAGRGGGLEQVPLRIPPLDGLAAGQVRGLMHLYQSRAKVGNLSLQNVKNTSRYLSPETWAASLDACAQTERDGVLDPALSNDRICSKLHHPVLG